MAYSEYDIEKIYIECNSMRIEKTKKKRNKKISEMRLYDDVINHIYKICSNGILKMERKLSFKKL